MNFGFTAFTAKTGEGEVTGIHQSTDFVSSLAAQASGYLDMREVRYTVAPLTDKVNMGFCVSIKPFDTIDSSQTDDQSLLFEQRQVAIHRSK